MANFVGLHNRVWMGHLDLSGQANVIEFGALTRAMRDCTTFNDGGYMCQVPGILSGAGRMSGFQDYADGVFDDEVSLAQLGTQYPFTVVPNPTGTVAAGDACWLSRGVVDTLNPLSGQVGDLAAAGLSVAYDAAAPRGLVLAAKAAVTATGTGTAVALAGPTASQKLYAGLHVFAYSGLTNVVFKVQSDDDSGFGSATDRITFATVSGTTSEWASVAGSFSSETHLRVSYTVTGTGSCTFAAVVGVI